MRMRPERSHTPSASTSAPPSEPTPTPSPSPPLPRPPVYGEQALDDTRVIRELYLQYQRPHYWLTPEQHWHALCRMLRELTPEFINALNWRYLDYWMCTMLHERTEDAVYAALDAARQRIPTNEFLALRTWLDHARHLSRRAHGDEEPTDLDTDEEEEEAPDPATARRPQSPSQPSTSAAPPPPARQSRRLRGHPPA